MPNFHVAVGGFVRNDAGDVLLIKSPRRGWEFPGGMVEMGESLPQALMREVKEESGADVMAEHIVGIYVNVERNIVNIDFACRYVGGELTTSEESLEVGWFSLAQAQEMITNELYVHRFQRMVDGGGHVYCDAFTREPFQVAESYALANREAHGDLV